MVALMIRSLDKQGQRGKGILATLVSGLQLGVSASQKLDTCGFLFPLEEAVLETFQYVAMYTLQSL